MLKTILSFLKNKEKNNKKTVLWANISPSIIQLSLGDSECLRCKGFMPAKALKHLGKNHM